MVMVHGLSCLAELSFYYAFASFVSVIGGGRYAMAGLLLQTACFALSSAVRGKKTLRLLALAPMGLFFLLPQMNTADAILFLGPAVYLLRQAYVGEYLLEWSRHVELFSAFWKSYAIFAFFTALGGAYSTLTASSLPIAIVMLFSSVLVMRTLRHAPETYLQRRYQLLNLLSVAAVTAVAAFLSSDGFLNACGAAASALYRSLVQPVLTVLLVIFVLVLRAFFALFSWLKIELPEGERAELKEIDSFAKDMGLGEMAEAGAIGKWILYLLLAVLLAAILFLFFRWLRNLGISAGRAPEVREERIASASSTGGERAPRSGTAVQRVRAQYRRFLKLYQSGGGEVRICDTSQDIRQESAKLAFDPDAAGELREIYIRARYAGQADRRDAARAKELCSAMKKERR